MISKYKYFIFFIFVLFYTAFLLWRVAHPLENRLSPNRYMHDETNHHDDLVSYVTAKNLNTEGFWNSYGVPNRRGVITQGYWGIPCSIKPGDDLKLPTSIKQNFDFVGADGNTVTSLTSSYENCYYTHFPPLSDWLGASFYKLGGRSFLSFKILSILVKGLGLFVLMCFFVRFFSPLAVLAGALVYSTFFYQITWASSLYMQPWSYLFLSLLFWEVTRFHRLRWWTALYVFLLYLTTLELMLAPLCALVLIAQKDWLNYLKKVFVGGIAAALLIYAQRALFFSSLWMPIEDMFVKAYSRYTFEHFSAWGWRLLFSSQLESVLLPLIGLSILCLLLLFFSTKQIRLLFLSLFFLLCGLWVLNPSYAMIHVNHWFGLLLIFFWAMLCFLFHWGLRLNFNEQKGRVFLKSMLLISALLISFALLKVNLTNLFNDYLLWTKARKDFQSQNLIYKPLVLLYTQRPHPSLPYYDYNVRDSFNDGIFGRFSYNEFVRPTYVELRNVQNFKLNIHFVDEQRFQKIDFVMNMPLVDSHFDCALKNLYRDTMVKAQINSQRQHISLLFPEQTGKDFQLVCEKLPKASLLELGIY